MTDENKQFVSRRTALKGVAVTAGAGTTLGAGMWFSARPAVAATLTGESGANNVVFDTTENVISVTEANIKPELAVDYSNFSSGVTSAQIDIGVSVLAEQTGDYIGTQDTWTAPTMAGTVTLSDTLATDGVENTYSELGGLQVSTPDFTGSTDTTGNFEFIDLVQLTEVVAQDGNVTDGTQMFPQDIDPDTYGLSVVTVDYSVTLNGAKGDSDSASLSHTFDVAVENESGTTDSLDADSNTGGSGSDGTQ